MLIPQLAGPSILAIAQGPTSAAAGAAISPAITVEVEDALGNLVTSDNSNVTLSIGSNPSGGNLLGTLTVAAVNGVATFSGLEIDTAGNGYTLVASDGGLTSATSAAFNITANPAQPTVAAPRRRVAQPRQRHDGQSFRPRRPIPAGEANLTYTWSATALPSGAAPPTFSANQTNAAKNTTATFSSAGTYVFLVTITDASGLSKASSVSVTVSQTFTSLSVSARPGDPLDAIAAAVYGHGTRSVRQRHGHAAGRDVDGRQRDDHAQRALHAACRGRIGHHNGPKRKRQRPRPA